MQTLLLLLILIPSPAKEKAPHPIVGTWVVTWGDSIKPYVAWFSEDGKYDSDDPWFDGRWDEDEQHRIVFTDRSGVWVLRIDDWQTMEGIGRKIMPDGTHAHEVKVKLRKQME